MYHPYLFTPELYPSEQFIPINLSVDNPDLRADLISDMSTLQGYIEHKLRKNNALGAYGGYLEQRNLYAGFRHFNPDPDAKRDMHLGIDYWLPVGTNVLAPANGVLHSFANNTLPGDYGPTLILEHEGAEPFYTLYGHLSVDSLAGLREGKRFNKGDVVGKLGYSDENGGYVPHLHFQVILDLQGNKGDYPGVCQKSDLEYYKKNCPDPLRFFTSIQD